MRGRHVVLGVSGGVAAYKAAYLCRRLQDAGAHVRVILTTSALEFIGARTFSSLTGEAPLVSLFDDHRASAHTALGRWADLFIVAPCTANTLSKLANGITGDALSATVSASDAPVFVAPAMHTEMWESAATQENVRKLQERGTTILGPAEGELAAGDVGVGRMLEPDDIVTAVFDATRGPLSGLRVLVSAGGTREPIDPVRYIGNRSSGKMGTAVAAVAARLGADVTLVTTLPMDDDRLDVVLVETAEEMAGEVWARSDACDVAVLAAAVADYRPQDASTAKLRRADGPPVINLEPTPDILKGVAAKDHRPYLVGFAAEVGSLDGAIEKAVRKGVDLLVANDVSLPGAGFGTDTNIVSFIRPDGEVEALPLMSKDEVAEQLWALVIPELPPR